MPVPVTMFLTISPPSNHNHLAAVGGGHGPFYSASHVGLTGPNNQESEWLGAGNPVPEPGTWFLLTMGLLGVAHRRRRAQH